MKIAENNGIAVIGTSLGLPHDKLLKMTLFKIGGEPVTLIWLLQLSLTFLIVVVFCRLFKRLLKERILTKLGIDQGNRETLSILLSYSTGVLIFVTVLEVNGIDLASLAVVVGSLGVGVGFGLQDITKNLASGLTLLLEGKLKVGDYIELNGLYGYIKEISMRSTLIHTFDGGDVVVPNSDLITKQVLNWSYQNFTGMIRLQLGVAYKTDPILVMETLLNVAYIEPDVLHDPPPRVIFIGFGDNSLDFELWAWVRRIDERISVKSSLYFAIEYNFRHLGIEIPFPQRDLWLRNPETLRLRQQKQSENSAASQSLQILSVRDLLKKIPYFGVCSDLQIRQIIELGYRKILAPDEIIFHEGNQGAAFYIILRGSVEMTIVKLNERISTHYSGEIFGEVSLMLGIPYSTTAQALEETIVFVIDKSNFEKLLRLSPNIAELIAQEFAKDKKTFSQVRQELQELGLLDIPESHQNPLVWFRTRLKKLFDF
jgi:small-conductance mechanosensitive channel